MDVADAAGTRSSADTQEKSKTFISYSRRDGLDFVEQLTSGLELTGFEPTVDRHSIAGGEDWRARIGGLIADADSVVFVITPESVSSEICEWEIVRSVQLGKRLIPVVPLPMADTPVPKRLLNLNQIFFYPEASVPGSGFGKGLAELCDSLRTDLDWVRSHTRYGQRAAEWLAGNKAANRLLSGGDVETAKAWLAKRQSNAPEVTDDIRTFIRASEQAETDRNNAEKKRLREKEETLRKIEAAQQERAKAQRRANWFLGVGIAASLLFAAISAWNWIEASSQRQLAEIYLDLIRVVNQIELGVLQPTEVTENQKRAASFVCEQAVLATKTLATTADPSAWEEAQGQFWDLYYGPMYSVEKYERYVRDGHPIESKMVAFGSALKKTDYVRGGQTDARLLPLKLHQEAAAVATACNAFRRLIGVQTDGI